MRPLQRPIQPVGPPGAYQTFQILSPPDRLFKAACKDVSCEAWMYGWETVVDENTDLGKAQAAYIRQQSGRTFKEQRCADGAVVFRFDSRQRCFGEHHTRGEHFSVHGGDWRRHLGVIRAHSRAADWVEHMQENQDAVRTRLERG